MYIQGSDQVAVFNYAAVFSMADDYYSGNLVPSENDLPENVPHDRM